jgi:hypothetical protein
MAFFPLFPVSHFYFLGQTHETSTLLYAWEGFIITPFQQAIFLDASRTLNIQSRANKNKV